MHHVKPNIIMARIKHRAGKGFSREEMEKAGVNANDGQRFELPVDKRRKTVHDDNVETIKAFAEKMRAEEKLKKEPKPELKPEKKKKAKS
jgi:ribosomal protein L13E